MLMHPSFQHQVHWTISSHPISSNHIPFNYATSHLGFGGLLSRLLQRPLQDPFLGVSNHQIIRHLWRYKPALKTSIMTRNAFDLGSRHFCSTPPTNHGPAETTTNSPARHYFLLYHSLSSKRCHNLDPY